MSKRLANLNTTGNTDPTVVDFRDSEGSPRKGIWFLIEAFQPVAHGSLR